MKEILDKIAELEQQLAVLKAEVEKEEKENKSTNKRWRGRCGQNYYYVTHDNNVRCKTDYYTSVDEFRYDTRNYFRSEQEAQKYANVIETERQLKKFADEHNDKIDWTNINQDKWSLYHSYSGYEVSIAIRCVTKDAGVIYFSSREIARQAIDEIGTDKIKEYLTYEW